MNEYKDDDEWPNASLFGVYDGHGGCKCADYLRDNVHNYLVQMQMYPWDPGQALHDALLFSEEQYKKENVLKN
jgi:serine/threonine protein phosphatase PrpC